MSASPTTAEFSSGIVEWRRERLLAAGFASALAARLSADSAIDLHALLTLIDRGCPPELALEIVR